MGAFVLFLVIVLIFSILGLLGGWLQSLSTQVCPACLGFMTKGATKCPHCHTPQEKVIKRS
jgi:hypothetical protein